MGAGWSLYSSALGAYWLWSIVNFFLENFLKDRNKTLILSSNCQNFWFSNFCLNQTNYNFIAEVTEYIIIGYPGRNWVTLVTKLSIDHSQWQKVISQRNHLVSVGCGGLRAAPYLAKLLNAADCGLMQSGTLDVWSCSAMNLWISSADSSCN